MFLFYKGQVSLQRLSKNRYFQREGGGTEGTQRYYPFGVTRSSSSSGSLNMDRLFTPIWGQTGQQEIGLGLYNDPTGHMEDECGDFGCGTDTPITPSVPNTSYSDWNSSTYSGCFKCHVATANNKPRATNAELALANRNANKFLAIEGLVVLPPVVVASGIITVETVGPPVLIACLTNPSCQKLIGVSGAAMLGINPDYVKMGESLNFEYLSITEGWSWEGSNVPYLVQKAAENKAFVLSNPASTATGK
jgi:hypothetical protein